MATGWHGMTSVFLLVGPWAQDSSIQNGRLGPLFSSERTASSTERMIQKQDSSFYWSLSVNNLLSTISDQLVVFYTLRPWGKSAGSLVVGERCGLNRIISEFEETVHTVSEDSEYTANSSYWNDGLSLFSWQEECSLINFSTFSRSRVNQLSTPWQNRWFEWRSVYLKNPLDRSSIGDTSFLALMNIIRRSLAVAFWFEEPYSNLQEANGFCISIPGYQSCS